VTLGYTLADTTGVQNFVEGYWRALTGMVMAFIAGFLTYWLFMVSDAVVELVNEPASPSLPPPTPSTQAAVDNNAIVGRRAFSGKRKK